jgi:plastocyanin
MILHGFLAQVSPKCQPGYARTNPLMPCKTKAAASTISESSSGRMAPGPWEVSMSGKFLLAGLAMVTALGCGGGGSDSTTAPSTGGADTVTVSNNFFSPADMTVAQGTTVTWQWAANDVSHNVTFDDGQSSPTQSSGNFQRTFSAAGTYPYHCTIHVALGMHGTVTVTASSGSSGTGGGAGGGGMGGGGGYGP